MVNGEWGLAQRDEGVAITLQMVGFSTWPPSVALHKRKWPAACTTTSPSHPAALQHIVGQLDVLTQTMALLDERLTMNEDRVQAMGERVDAALATAVAATAAAAERGAGSGAQGKQQVGWVAQQQQQQGGGDVQVPGLAADQLGR